MSGETGMDKIFIMQNFTANFTFGAVQVFSRQLWACVAWLKDFAG